MRAFAGRCGRLNRVSTAPPQIETVDALQRAAIVIVLTLSIVNECQGQATFVPLAGQVRAQVAGQPLMLEVIDYGTMSVSDEVFFPNVNTAAASITISLADDRRLDFALSANTLTNAVAPDGMNNAFSLVDFLQSFSLDVLQWVEVAANVSAPNAANVSVNFAFSEAGEPPLFAPGDTDRRLASWNGLLDAGNFRVQGSVSSAAYLPGEQYHSGRIAGWLLVADFADFNGNGEIDSEDVDTWLGNYGKNESNFASGDVDGNGVTDGADAMLIQRQMGTMTQQLPTSVTAAPEPGAMALAATALWCCFWRRAR